MENDLACCNNIANVLRVDSVIPPDVPPLYSRQTLNSFLVNFLQTDESKPIKPNSFGGYGADWSVIKKKGLEKKIEQLESCFQNIIKETKEFFPDGMVANHDGSIEFNGLILNEEEKKAFIDKYF